jgi:hypothetical protein
VHTDHGVLIMGFGNSGLGQDHARAHTFNAPCVLVIEPIRTSPAYPHGHRTDSLAKAKPSPSEGAMAVVVPPHDDHQRGDVGQQQAGRERQAHHPTQWQDPQQEPASDQRVRFNMILRCQKYLS